MFAGKCMGGPYAGQEHAHHDSVLHVIWLEGNPLHDLAWKREGTYHFQNGVWLWGGAPITHGQ